MKTWLAAAFVAMLATGPAFAQSDADVDGAISTLFGDPAPFVEAFDAIQDAVANDDPEAFAAWVSYPFKTTMDGEDYVLDTPEALAEHYEMLMTDDIRSAIVDQQYKDLFVNAEGVMFGNGQVWLSSICKDDACAEADVRIITIQSTAQ